MSNLSTRLARLEQMPLAAPRQPQPCPWTLAAQAICDDAPDHAAKEAFLDLVRAVNDAEYAAIARGETEPEIDIPEWQCLNELVDAKLTEITGGCIERLADLCHCSVADLVRTGYVTEDGGEANGQNAR